jgi:hypothetical protein
MELWERMQLILSETGWSGRRWAELAGVSGSHVTLTIGGKGPTSTTLEKLANEAARTYMQLPISAPTLTTVDIMTTTVSVSSHSGWQESQMVIVVESGMVVIVVPDPPPGTTGRRRVAVGKVGNGCLVACAARSVLAEGEAVEEPRECGS